MSSPNLSNLEGGSPLLKQGGSASVLREKALASLRFSAGITLLTLSPYRRALANRGVMRMFKKEKNRRD